MNVYRNTVSSKAPAPKPRNNIGAALVGTILMVIMGLLIFFQYKGVDFLEKAPDGSPRLSPKRSAKLKKELDELDEAEQYVLLAEINGEYPCFSCPSLSSIYLQKGEVWKYGVTQKPGGARYSSKYLTNMYLFYETQFVGTIQKCLKEEKRKIYYYAVRPENLKRKIPLIRPPDNKQDN